MVFQQFPHHRKYDPYQYLLTELHLLSAPATHQQGKNQKRQRVVASRIVDEDPMRIDTLYLAELILPERDQRFRLHEGVDLIFYVQQIVSDYTNPLLAKLSGTTEVFISATEARQRTISPVTLHPLRLAPQWYAGLVSQIDFDDKGYAIF